MKRIINKHKHIERVVVAQLTERSLSMQEILSSNPVMEFFLLCTFLLLTVGKTKIKKKRPGMAHSKHTLIKR